MHVDSRAWYSNAVTSFTKSRSFKGCGIFINFNGMFQVGIQVLKCAGQHNHPAYGDRS